MKSGSAIIAIAGATVAAIVGGSVALTTSNTSLPDTLFVIFFVVLSFVLIGFIVFAVFKPMIQHNRLNRVGISKTGTVLEVHDTGITVNKRPQVKLVIELKNEFGQSYTANLQVLVPRLNPMLFQVGSQIPVKVDPKNEQTIALDESKERSTTHNFTNQANAFSAFQSMTSHHTAGRTGERIAKAIVKKITKLENRSLGDNPFVELEIQVLPDHSPSFSGIVRGEILQNSWEHYQPGKEIHVKYDPNNPANIVLT